MNERIKELWNLSRNPSGRGHNEEKFAQLIVKECADICYKHPARMPTNNWQGVTVPLDIAQRLEKHFGVEK
jgi:hypothetical protein